MINDQGQFSEDQVKETQEIANLRIHVERAISRIKKYKILQNVFPINQAGLLNQILFHSLNHFTQNNGVVSRVVINNRKVSILSS